jgi:hypothetical protein
MWRHDAGGKMCILCAIHPPKAIRKILDCLGIPSRPPPISPAIFESSTEEYLNYYLPAAWSDRAQAKPCQFFVFFPPISA